MSTSKLVLITTLLVIAITVSVVVASDSPPSYKEIEIPHAPGPCHDCRDLHYAITITLKKSDEGGYKSFIYKAKVEINNIPYECDKDVCFYSGDLRDVAGGTVIYKFYAKTCSLGCDYSYSDVDVSIYELFATAFAPGEWYGGCTWAYGGSKELTCEHCARECSCHENSECCWEKYSSSSATDYSFSKTFACEVAGVYPDVSCEDNGLETYAQVKAYLVYYYTFVVKVSAYLLFPESGERVELSTSDFLISASYESSRSKPDVRSAEDYYVLYFVKPRSDVTVKISPSSITTERNSPLFFVVSKVETKSTAKPATSIVSPLFFVVSVFFLFLFSLFTISLCLILYFPSLSPPQDICHCFVGFIARLGARVPAGEFAGFSGLAFFSPDPSGASLPRPLNFSCLDFCFFKVYVHIYGCLFFKK